MRNLHRQLATVLMALVIGLTSVQLAAARGQAPAVGMMEICTGTGPIHILVDENGQPTGNVMICPDYALAFFADPAPNPTSAQRTDIWQTLRFDRTAAVSADHRSPESQARGPPSFCLIA